MKGVHKCLFIRFVFTECGGDLSSSTGVITSPNYPGLYPHNRVCTWNIRVAQGRRVTLNIDSFNMEGGNSNCGYDYVEVRTSGSHKVVGSH